MNIVRKAVADNRLSGELIGHVARDATAIERNKEPVKKEEKQKASMKRDRPKTVETREPEEEK